MKTQAHRPSFGSTFTYRLTVPHNQQEGAFIAELDKVLQALPEDEVTLVTPIQEPIESLLVSVPSSNDTMLEQLAQLFNIPFIRDAHSIADTTKRPEIELRAINWLDAYKTQKTPETTIH